MQVCKAGAISHDQRETDLHLNVGAIVYADDPAKQIPGFSAPLRFASGVIKKPGISTERDGIYRVAPEDPLSASAVAADILGGWGKRTRSSAVSPVPALARNAFRIGVFICECGGQISSILDTGRMRRKLAALSGVVHAQVLPFSCSSEAAETIRAAVDAHQLDKAVLAACSCCSMDQVCFSCTYQRLRCRRDLGVLPHFDGSFPGLDTVRFAFVNIREQCAWVHADQPVKATATAIALVTAAVAGLRKEAVRPKVLEYVERSALILGRGEAASICKELLEKAGNIRGTRPGNAGLGQAHRRQVSCLAGRADLGRGGADPGATRCGGGGSFTGGLWARRITPSRPIGVGRAGDPSPGRLFLRPRPRSGFDRESRGRAGGGLAGPGGKANSVRGDG